MNNFFSIQTNYILDCEYVNETNFFLASIFPPYLSIGVLSEAQNIGLALASTLGNNYPGIRLREGIVQVQHRRTG